MAAAQTRVTIAAGNISNASTDGFARRVAHGRLTAAGAVVEQRVSEERGAFRRTGRELDLAIVGRGTFHVLGPDGRIVDSRSGSFERAADGRLRDDRGRVLYGSCGPVTVTGAVSIAPDGTVFDDGVMRNHLPLPSGSRVETGFLESSGVDAVGQMVDMVAAQRSFETAEKVVAAIDGVRQKSNGDVGRLK